MIIIIIIINYNNTLINVVGVGTIYTITILTKCDIILSGLFF